jgi:GAF domain-containing protein
MATRDLVTRTMVELADTLVDDFDVVELFTLLTDRCCEAFAVDAAGLMLAAPVGGELAVMASSSTTMRDLEVYELQASEGPCLDCYRSGHPVVNEPLATSSDRWPSFAPVAVDAGFRTVTALPMRLRGLTIGALNLFRSSIEPIGEAELVEARAFADVATIAILQHQAALDAHRLNEQLDHALNSRILIEQAKGMLAERADLGVDEAFDWLRRYARSHRLRLVDVAQSIIDGHISLSSIAATAGPR